MNGWLLVDKPSGISSHDVVQRARGIIPGCRIGHTGTLDPLATGLLVLGIGNTTRLSEYLISQPKKYTAVVRLGATTTTFDADGDIMSEEDVRIGAAAIESILPNFMGCIEQVPPIYSAIKIGGKRAYKLARSGKQAPRLTRSLHHPQRVLSRCPHASKTRSIYRLDSTLDPLGQSRPGVACETRLVFAPGYS